MSHVALYRKYRSQTFGDLIGQEHVVRTLQNAIRQGNIHHAYLFTGPRGTGKTSSARLLAKTLNCPNATDGEPCNTCDLCVSISQGHCMDVIEMDAASEAGVDEVREKIVDVVEYRPAIAKYKVFIIDEVHDLSSKAFDALLKTIEEPPGHIVFVLATTELHKVPPTIQSRCQKFQFHRASMADLVKRLEFVMTSEGWTFEPAALQILARMADGGFRDALSLLEQAMLTAEGQKLELTHVIEQLGLIRDEVIDQLLVAVGRREHSRTIELVDQIYRSGRDPKSMLEAMLLRLAELTRVAYGVEIGSTGEATQEAAMKATASQLGPDLILRLRDRIAGGVRDIRDVSLPKIWLESYLLGFGVEPVAAPVVAVAAPAPTQAAVRTVAEPPRETYTPHAPSQPPANAVPAAHRDLPTPERDLPEIADAESAWRKVVTELTQKSRVAGALLAKSAVVDIVSEDVFVGFLRQLDLDQLTKNHKLIAALNENWNSLKPNPHWNLSFRLSANAKSKPVVEESAVELPAEGARLADMAKEVFKDF